MKSYRLEHPFSLSDTLKSGQLFHWEPLELNGFEGYAGCIGDSPPSWIAQKNDGEVWMSGPDLRAIARYFGLDQDIKAIHATFPKDDEVLARAIDYCPGIRIVRQPLWECLATFITSSLKQVAHIRAISLKIRKMYGTRYQLNGLPFYAYPSSSALAEVGEDKLRECALGYRAKSLDLAANALASGEIDLEAVEHELCESEARNELIRLHGVGEKVANCALLFGAGRWGAFPIDVWIERILRDHYRKRLKGRQLQAWSSKYFGRNAGYAQQYLFHFARKTL
jgi:N-glycosylase/DNA lyase